MKNSTAFAKSSTYKNSLRGFPEPHILNWKPEVSFKELVKLMVEHDLEEAAKEKVLLENNLIQPSWENFK